MSSINSVISSTFVSPLQANTSRASANGQKLGNQTFKAPNQSIPNPFPPILMQLILLLIQALMGQLKGGSEKTDNMTGDDQRSKVGAKELNEKVADKLSTSHQEKKLMDATGRSDSQVIENKMINNDSKEKKTDIIKKVSPYSVSETMNRFESIVKKKNFDVFSRIDHKKNAEEAGLTMNDSQVLIFGNPKGGTALMNKNIGISLDLPLRVAVYQGADDKVYIAYHDPESVASRHDLDGHQVIDTLMKGLDKLTLAAITE